MTVAADMAADLVNHVVYLAAGLPREGRTIPEAMMMRNAEDGEIDVDVTGMLERGDRPVGVRAAHDRRVALSVPQPS